MKMKASFFSALALAMSFAGIAAAQDPPPYAPPPAARPMPAEITFGAPGQLVISDDMQVAVIHSSQSFMGDSFSSTTFQLQPAVDYFVAPNFSIGGQLTVAYSSADDGVGGSLNQTAVGILPRVGYNLALAPTASIWPRVAFGYVHVSADAGAGSASASGYSVTLEAFVPVIFHPVPHFFIGGGPILTTEVISKIEDADAPKTTNIGLLSTIGGYFGGM
jgi:hypothetical protein